jgi:hypothetical protein
MFASALLTILLASSGPVQTGASPERIVRIEVPNHDAVYALQHRVRLAIIDAQAKAVLAYADDDKIQELRNLGYPVTVLVEDYQTLTAPLGTYATYAEVCSTMNVLAGQYPAITKLETLGISLAGRAILIMKVTANPAQETNKPRIRLNGPHHGNEKIATEITLSLLEYLCERYDTNALVHSLVDSRESWIDPIFNVDGHVANRRTNNNGVDLNRDYGYEWDPSETPGPFSQVETQAMRAHAEKHVLNLEYSYHSTAAYVNYLWDNHPADPPDSGYIISLSQRYADSTYGSGTQLQEINGYDWYEVHGSCQDNTFGNYGGLAWTIETDLPSNRAAVDNICNANRRALLDMIHLADWGVSGLVHDSLTGAPLFARVEFVNPSRWITYTQPEVGDFHEMLPPGTYSVRVTANGYLPMTFTGVVVPDTGAVALDAALVRPGYEIENCAQKTVMVRRYDDSHTLRSWTIQALGRPDSVYYDVGPSPSFVVFDVDPFVPVRNQVGNDITVYATGSYVLYAANNWEGPWFSLGNGSGTTSFDLAGASLDSARYLKIAGTSSARIDAISYLGAPLTVVETPDLARLLTRFSVSPNPAARQAKIELGLGAPVSGDIRVMDITGRVFRTIAQGTALGRRAQLTWDLRDDAGRNVPDGVYFCAVSTGSGSASRKIVVER